MHSCSTAVKENKHLSHSLLPEPWYAFIIIATTAMLSICTVGNAGLVVLWWQNELIWAGTYICHRALSLSVASRNWAIARFSLWTYQAEVWTATIVISTRIWVWELSQRVVYVYIIWTMCCVADYCQVFACWCRTKHYNQPQIQCASCLHNRCSYHNIHSCLQTAHFLSNIKRYHAPHMPKCVYLQLTLTYTYNRQAEQLVNILFFKCRIWNSCDGNYEEYQVFWDMTPHSHTQKKDRLCPAEGP